MIKLLIVDDDIPTVEVIRTSVDFDKLDINQVYTAYNVSSARKLLKEQEIDIIISDIEMPQESGLDLLKWIRENKIDCEFLLLTCHESFSYAANAISYDAAAYLTKPFDIHIMELNLQKIVLKLKQKRSLRKTSEYGVWMERNLRYMKQNFWKSVLEGELLDNAHMEYEIKKRHLEIQCNRQYCLIYTKFSNTDTDMERYGKGVVEFILEGFHSELITGKVENESVIKYYEADILSFITVCDSETGKLKDKCEQLIETCAGYFKATVTCCISKAYPITELSAAKQRLKKLFDYNIGYFGKIFYENEVGTPENSELTILNLDKMVELVEHKDKAGILHYLKQLFDELTVYKRLNLHALYLMKQEITQVVYADLMKQGIQATRLFYDELSIKMSEHAMDSTVDMIRWVNYLLEKTFEYEDEIAKSATIIDRINEYIHEHYPEPIGRNEISGIFYLTPEYLSKLYKKKTGTALKDYINEYRIEKAKELLRTENKNVSDIAEAVGFDNFSYFSTLFKKMTGVSPKDYKNI